jgi:hypothetical protein
MTTKGKKAIRAALNRLALTPIRKCAASHPCCFCNQPILLGDEYRNAGNLRSHEYCFKAIAQQY